MSEYKYDLLSIGGREEPIIGALLAIAERLERIAECVEPEIKSPQVDEAAGFLGDALLTDGEHHKQWYLEQIANALDVKLALNHEPGIAP